MYEKFLNKHVQAVKPSGIRKYFGLASEMEGVTSLGVGEPDLDTPWHIREAAIYPIENGETHYTANQGLLELREEACLYQKRRLQLDYDPVDSVIVTIGGSEAIDVTMHAITSPGDEVILMESSYVVYTPSVKLTGVVPVHIKLEHENQFKLTPEKLKAAIIPKTKAILMNFPSNSTGGVMTRRNCAELVPILKEHEIIVIGDEIYVESICDGTFCPPTDFNEIEDQVIIISGFSKAYTIAGRRLGYVPINKAFTDVMNKVHQYIIMFAPAAVRYGAINTMRNGDIHIVEMRELYMVKRNFTTKGLNRIDLPVHLPHGTFYIFLDIRGIGLTSGEFCVQSLEDQRATCVPDTAFGDAGEGFIRIPYAYSISHTREAIERIDHFTGKFRQR